MITINIPGSDQLIINHLVLDFNGTLAEDGELIRGVSERLELLKKNIEIHVITADTHGTVSDKLTTLPVHLEIIGTGSQDALKAAYIKGLGADTVVAMGNGRNDGRMLTAARLGVGLLQKEGAAAAVLKTADIICTDICDALDLLLIPDRLRATLRN
jgi:soluble P-type ATPase